LHKIIAFSVSSAFSRLWKKEKNITGVSMTCFLHLKPGCTSVRPLVGEIGVVKKDIVYSGDVLNTTSRIQAECNKNNVDLLLSSDLVEQIQLNDEYQQTALGEISLKGKKDKVLLYTIRLFN
jgi:class 3 adenylate cyclase